MMSGERPEALSTDVFIAGGGMVGMTLGVALADAGLAVVVADAESPEAAVAPAFDGRASAIAYASYRLLERTGVWRHLAPEAQPIEEIRVSDGASRFFLHFDQAELGEGPLGYMAENRHIRAALFARAGELENLTVLAPETVVEVDRTGARAQARLAGGGTVKSALVAAADGRMSPLRAAAGIRTTAWRYEQAGIVATIAHALPHCGIAHERFLPPGPFAILPLAGNRSSLVWTTEAGLAPAIMALPEAAFAAEVAKRVGGFLGETEIVGPRFSYPLGLHVSERYAAGRLALVGDAAHGIHPIAGQGLNLGFRDVAALVEVLADAHRLGQDLGQATVLDRYARWRRTDNLVLAAVTDGLNRLFSNDFPPLRLARDIGLGMVNRLPPARRFFMRHARGTVGKLPKLLRGEAV